MFHSVDPLAEVNPSWSVYKYAADNPVSYFDPTGMLESTHTDSLGNVVKVFDDGDTGVYKHKGNRREAKKEAEEKHSDVNTAAGGEKMGESLHSLSFVNQNLYNETGEVKAANIKIDFGSTELTDLVQAILKEKPSLLKYALMARSNHDWDLKSNRSLHGSKLYGKYASPRDAGNFAAGAVAVMSGFPNVAQFGYGAYNLTGNSIPKTAILTVYTMQTMILNPVVGYQLIKTISNGEDILSQKEINIGKQFIENGGL